MARRVHVSNLSPGVLPLDADATHHLLSVLRLKDGDEVEAFDDAGNLARARLIATGSKCSIRVDAMSPAEAPMALQWSIASAVPKGERADWMVEKLSELGCSELFPLEAERSVVLPRGRGKHERWTRIATEAARQSRRAGVMTIHPLTPLEAAVASVANAPTTRGWVLSTDSSALPIASQLASLPLISKLVMFVGPEGGWTDQERALFESAGISQISLGTTILRVETAAIAAGSIIAALSCRPPYA